MGTLKMKIDKIPIEEVIPYKNNPRKNKEAVEIVKASIEEFGFQNPIILDKKNIIIAGHTRLLAAQELGLKEVPVIFAKDLSEAQTKALRIMDNKSAEKATWNFSKLRDEFSSLGDMSFDLNLTGFVDSEMSAIFAGEEPITDENIVKQLGNLLITCPKCQHKFKKSEFKTGSHPDY